MSLSKAALQSVNYYSTSVKFLGNISFSYLSFFFCRGKDGSLAFNMHGTCSSTLQLAKISTAISKKHSPTWKKYEEKIARVSMEISMFRACDDVKMITHDKWWRLSL